MSMPSNTNPKLAKRKKTASKKMAMNLGGVVRQMALRFQIVACF